MTSTADNSAYSTVTSNHSESKRKVSILTNDHPPASAYDNLGFESHPSRKISQVKIELSNWNSSANQSSTCVLVVIVTQYIYQVDCLDFSSIRHTRTAIHLRERRAFCTIHWHQSSKRSNCCKYKITTMLNRSHSSLEFIQCRPLFQHCSWMVSARTRFNLCTL